jgi:cytochrome c biogenesis protein CcmG/thiol:disulfide interchange protein DsbE
MAHMRRSAPAVVWASLLMLLGAMPSFAGEAKVPDFTLTDLGGDEVTLSELLKDGPVILDFWATWCKPCIKAFPELQKILDTYEGCGLRVLAVSIDGPRSVSRVGAVMKAKGHTFDVVLDPAQRVARKYHVTSVPRTLLVNTDGKAVFAATGYRPGRQTELEEAVKALLPGECPKKVDAKEAPVEP